MWCFNILELFAALVTEPAIPEGPLQTISRFSTFISQWDFVNQFFVLICSLLALALSVLVLLGKNLIKIPVTQRRKKMEIRCVFPKFFLGHEHTNK